MMGLSSATTMKDLRRDPDESEMLWNPVVPQPGNVCDHATVGSDHLDGVWTVPIPATKNTDPGAVPGVTVCSCADDPRLGKGRVGEDE